MSKPTLEQIAAEIAALKALKPVGRFAEKTAASIEVEIGAIEGTIDETADEFQEMNEDAVDCYNSARAWRDGASKNRPSEGWVGLVE